MHRKARLQSRGIALITVLFLMILITSVALVMILRGNFNLATIPYQTKSLTAFYIAECGLAQKSMEVYEQYVLPQNTLLSIGNLVASPDQNRYFTIYDAAGRPTGYCTVRYLIDSPRLSQPTGAKQLDTDYKTVTIRVSGSTDSPPAGSTVFPSYAVVRTVQHSFNVGNPDGPYSSDPLSFAYLMNHWAWWSGFGVDSSGNKARIIGNTASNAYYDVLPYSRIFVKNKDGGSDKGIAYTPSNSTISYSECLFAQLNIRTYYGAQIDGPGGSSNNQYQTTGPDHPGLKINVPYITDMAPYEELAKTRGDTMNPTPGTVGIRTVKVIRRPVGNLTRDECVRVLSEQTVIGDGVYGDSTGEKQSLVLAGSTKRPENWVVGEVLKVVVVDGPVVVRENTVLKGWVTGRGTIYTGRNLYVAGDVMYWNPPSNAPGLRPNTGEYEAVKLPRGDADAGTEDFAKDAIVYATRKNVIYGDVTDKTFWWDWGCAGWINYTDYDVDPRGIRINDNHEDAGTDNIVDNPNLSNPNEKENDGKWTVKLRNRSTGEMTERDLGLVYDPASRKMVANVPTGYEVIRGSGEDTDGDGLYTNPYDYYRDFNFASLSGSTQSFSSYYFGNYPTGIGSYSTFEEPITRLDGYLMTNNALAGGLGNGSDSVIFFGGEMGRQDSQLVDIGSRGRMIMYQDARMAQDSDDLYVPKVPIMTRVNWTEL